MEYKFKIKDGREADYETLKVNNSVGVGKIIMLYAEKWGSMMEVEMAQGSTVAEAANATWLAADEWRTSGSMFGFTTGVLTEFWEHGDALADWQENRYRINTNTGGPTEEVQAGEPNEDFNESQEITML